MQKFLGIGRVRSIEKGTTNNNYSDCRKHSRRLHHQQNFYDRLEDNSKIRNHSAQEILNQGKITCRQDTNWSRTKTKELLCTQTLCDQYGLDIRWLWEFKYKYKKQDVLLNDFSTRWSILPHWTPFFMKATIIFPNQWIDRSSLIFWPTQSEGINPLNFFLWS